MSVTTAAVNQNKVSIEPIESDQLSPGKAVVMHLLPGAAIMAAFVVLSQALKGSGLTNMSVFIIAASIALLGGQLGFLLVQGWKRNGRLSLEGIVLYRETMAVKTYLWLVPAVLLASIVLFIGLSLIDGLLYSSFFSWWPAAWDLNLDPSNQATSFTLASVVMMYLVVNISGPVVEELYFRGYLLPRLERYGRLAPVINAVLFAAYHFWSPWAVVSRAIAILPLAYTVRSRKNIMVGIWVHCALNCIGSIPLLLAVL